jgi:hypothetical protein
MKISFALFLTFALFFAAVVPAMANTALVPSYWAASWTDASGNYNMYSPVATLAGGVLTGIIPTDSNQASPDNEVDNYFRTSETLANGASDGILLGDMSGYTGVSATFRINNDTLAPGAPFLASQLVGETYPGLIGSNAGLRISFRGADINGNRNQWWSGAASFVTSMDNGDYVTLTVLFDPSLWSNLNGTNGQNDTADFDSALTSVQNLGLSFGSGYFASDGFAFDTGGSATIQLASMNGTSDAPEPASMFLLGGGLIGIAIAFRRRSARTGASTNR